MLDDLKMIHERDAQDTLGIAEKQWQQLEQVFETKSYDGFQPDNIVYAGMGGSALAALVSSTWPGYTVPFEIVRTYDVPAYVGPKTLVVVASYSGNTEEALSVLEQARERRSKIAVIAGGGKLQALAEEHRYPLAVLSKVEQPRYAVLSNLNALVQMLAGYNVLNTKNAQSQMAEAAGFLQKATALWRPDVATNDNPAKQLAQELIGQSVVIYAGTKFSPAAYKWKISLNENAKHVAWAGEYPEFNHNEFMGWTKQPVEKPYHIVDLRSSFEHPRINKRFELTERLLSGLRPAPHIVVSEGDNLLEQLLWVIAYGDFVTIYVALLNGVNPAPVELIERFKKELDA